MTALSATVAVVPGLLEAEKAEDTVSGGARNVDGFNLFLGFSEDPVGNSENNARLFGLCIVLFVGREGRRNLGMRCSSCNIRN